MKILVTGGAGYIGSFMVKGLLDRGHQVVVFDNLERGHKEAVDKHAKLVTGDIKSREDLERLFSKHQIDAVMHFAGLIAVAESEREPELYFQNNVVGSTNLFEAAISVGKVKNFIFSSSAAVYGNPIEVPITEDHPKNPTSEYGKNKLEVENILVKLRNEKSDMNFASLRYFNAAGASLDGTSGEAHFPETHIIPLAIKSVIEKSDFKLYGTDYNTPDGTCVRDYIHVLDLVEAHILALEYIINNSGGYFFNVGTGNGYSNKEVISMIEAVSRGRVNVTEDVRRTGDADRLVADPSKIKKVLGFNPTNSDLKTIIESAWKWHSGNFK